MTPENLQAQLQQQVREREILTRKIDFQRNLFKLENINNKVTVPKLNRINQSILEKVTNIKGKITSQLFELLDKIGVQGADIQNFKLPETCPTEKVLIQALEIRNNIVNTLSNFLEYVNTVENSFQGLSDLVNGTVNSLNVLNTLKTVSSLTAKALPVVPGAVASLLADLDDIRTAITFTSDGSPKLPKIKQDLEIGLDYLEEASNTVNTLLQVIQIVDLALTQCKKQPAELGNNIKKLIDRVSENIAGTTYNGFTFNIIQKPFSQTINQSIGQAINKEGVVLLQTEPSFTLNPQTLIDELIFIIDRDNLKSN